MTKLIATMVACFAIIVLPQPLGLALAALALVIIIPDVVHAIANARLRRKGKST